MRARIAIMLAVAAAAVPGESAAQGRFPALAESYEIELARTAAPGWLSDSATIYVYRGGRHVVAQRGTRGACAVVRDHPESVVPICFDDEAARTILAYEFLLHRLRDRGLTENSVKDSIAGALERGDFTLPRRPAFTYMMSRDQVLYTAPAGQRVGAWKPHVMIFYPNFTPEELGMTAASSGGHIHVAHPGTPTSHIIIVVPDWARPASLTSPGG